MGSTATLVAVALAAAGPVLFSSTRDGVDWAVLMTFLLLLSLAR